ncbi:MAG: two-component regulator propeller domain-containing protein [Bacteroidales bacterium]|nr:two-component regulator propeller domain-containing protein [Bacteroidales bacterium]
MKPVLLLKFILLFLTFQSIFRMDAQSPHFKNFNILKGKKNFTINEIFQDHIGYLWFGTSEGLIRYNGINYELYSVENNLPDNFITSIGENDQNIIWVGHKSGKISLLNNNNISQFTLLDSLISESVSKIFFIQQEIWIGTLGNGLFRIKDGEISIFNSDSEIGDDYIYDIKKDATNNLYIGTDIGLLTYNLSQNTWHSFSMKDGLPDNIIKNIEIDEKGSLWLGMEDEGLAIFNPETKKITQVPMWKFGPLNSFIIRNPGEIWASTRNEGVVKLSFKDENTFSYKKYLPKNGLINNQTFNIFKDNEKNVWVAAKNGVSQFTGNLFEFLNINEGLPSNEVFSFIIDSKSNYWICSKKGLYVLSKSVTGDFSSKQLLSDVGFENHSFTSVYEDAKGYIWVGTYGYGTYRFNPETFDFKVFNTETGLSNNNIISISGKNNLVWFSTFGGGIDYCDISKPTIEFKNYSTEDGLGSNYIYSSYTDSKSRVWFAKDGGGIAVLENGKIKTFAEVDSISNVVYGIAEDHMQNMWFTTANQGILKYDGKKFTHFNKKNKLLSNSYQSLTIDNYGNSILVGNDGVTVYDIEKNLFLDYTEEEGVSYLEPNLNAIFKAKTGDIWIGTNKGIIKYNPDVKKEQKAHPKIYLISKKAFFKEIPPEDNELNYDQNHLEFKYIGLWLKAPESLIYRYKLEGHDISWSYDTKSLIAIYSSLQPGKFTFKVQVTNELGKWSDDQMAEYSFIINPPFWRRWWFISSLVLITAALIYLLFRLRLANLTKAKERLELEVQKRTAEIERQRDEIEEKNKNITDSILYASRIQTAVLPPTEFLNATLPEHFILFKPRDIVSGDYYWMTQKGDEIVIAVADCTGHGVPGAFMSMLGVAFLNEIVNRAEKLVASNILNGLRDNVKNSLRQTGKKDEAKDGMDIALCVLNQSKKCLQYAGAYNPLYLMRNEELQQFKADRMPIGIYYKEKQSFTNNIVGLQDNDVIYLFSDGYIDQFGGDNGKKFLRKQFKDLIIEIHKKPLIEQKEILDKTLEEWMGEYEQVDDILIMGFKIS